MLDVGVNVCKPLDNIPISTAVDEDVKKSISRVLGLMKNNSIFKGLNCWTVIIVLFYCETFICQVVILMIFISLILSPYQSWIIDLVSWDIVILLSQFSILNI